MGKENEEELCLRNLLHGGANIYTKKKLKSLRKSERKENWMESPDFLYEDETTIWGIEHFAIDYAIEENNRSGSRLLRDGINKTYVKYKDDVISGRYDEVEVAKVLNDHVQGVFDAVKSFNSKKLYNEFERIFIKHLNKVEKYNKNIYENFSGDKYRKLVFMIEINTLCLNGNRNAVIVQVLRQDNKWINEIGYNVILTEPILHIIKRAIGKIDGVILQTYGYIDKNKNLKDMVYLDLTSYDALMESIEEQRLKIYKDVRIWDPQIKSKIIIKR